ncbi:MAG: AMP-binding protein, partial [Chloroflexota bacterium]
PAERGRAARAAGHWPERLATDYLDEALRLAPERIALTGRNSMTGQTESLDYRTLAARVDRIALGLAALGVERGEVVSFQLPNWWQYVALYLACVRIGAVANPLLPIYRERELRYMLEFSEARVAIVPAQFRGCDHARMIEELRPGLPALRRAFAVGGEGEASFERYFLERPWERERDAQALFRERRPGADELTQIMYTSGTSGSPKGVMHTSNTLLCAPHQFIELIGLAEGDAVLMGSPMGHQTGFLYGMLMPLVLRSKLVLLDLWSAAEAGRLIESEAVSFTMGSTPFLSDLANEPSVTRASLRTLKAMVCAGAPIPSAIVRLAAERLGLRVLSAWGMTENGAVTLTRPGAPPEKVFGTDGKAVPAMQVRVVDGAGRELPRGEAGNLQARGAMSFVGYLKKPELNATDADGWFETGDLAYMDADDYIRIAGRSKDVIIRGGENVPVVEIENVLYRHPKIQDAAVVAMPDARLGERSCAFVVTRPGETLGFAEMLEHFAAAQMAKAYWPERLEIIAEMPRTASGKIQKFRLREIAARF